MKEQTRYYIIYKLKKLKVDTANSIESAVQIAKRLGGYHYTNEFYIYDTKLKQVVNEKGKPIERSIQK